MGPRQPFDSVDLHNHQTGTIHSLRLFLRSRQLPGRRDCQKARGTSSGQRLTVDILSEAPLLFMFLFCFFIFPLSELFMAAFWDWGCPPISHHNCKSKRKPWVSFSGSAHAFEPQALEPCPTTRPWACNVYHFCILADFHANCKLCGSFRRQY